MLLQIIRLEFISFDVQFNIEFLHNASCSNDNVNIYDGADSSSPLLAVFCGSMLPGDVISSSRSLFVTFESDTSVTASGFEINYSAQEEGGMSRIGEVSVTT